MLGAADAQIAAANATLQQNKSIENQVALTNALANREGVLAQIEGLRSEQKANDLSLNKELLDLTKTKNEAETQLAIDQKQFDAERLKDEEAILLAKKSALEFAQTQELERLQNVINTTKEGTQARIDAENEYAAKKQEIENQITTTQDEIDTYRFEKKLEKDQLIIENDALAFETRLETLTEQERLITEATNISEEERTALLKANAETRIKIGEAEKSAQMAQMVSVSNALDGLSRIAGEKTAAGKALAIASATINTYKGISEVWGAKSMGNPVVDMAVKIASTAIVAAQGIANVQKIMSVQVPGGGGGGGASVGPPPAPPQFNVVGQGGANQIAESISGRETQPVRAFVVGSDVTTQQGLNRGIVQNATLG
jgi:hypothetical protein